MEYLANLALQRNDTAKASGNVTLFGGGGSAFQGPGSTTDIGSIMSTNMTRSAPTNQPTGENSDVSNGFGVLTPTRQKRDARATSPDQL